MASSDQDRFQVRPKAPRKASGTKSKAFVSQVLKAVSKSGVRASGASGARPASTFGRGRVAAGVAGRGLGANARRVIIKSRFVVLKRAGANAVAAHLRYIERDGVTRDGEKGQAYGAETDTADLKAFEERSRGDRHQFRFIVSPDDAADMEDLKGFTRQLMQRMQIDLETPLDWVAVDHWDTDNPHTHVVLRGRVGSERQGRDLVIAPDYMAQGMRMRASEIATEWLGPRTELEMRQSLQREVDQQRFTSLDRQLLRQTSMDVVDLSRSPGTGLDGQRQNVLRARLQRLESIALSSRIDANRWRLMPGMERTLTAMGERGDILRTMYRAMKGEQRELVTSVPDNLHVVGRIAGKGLHDELTDRPYLVIDGMDGRAHYLKLPTGTDLSELPVGGIVEAKPQARGRAVDVNILAASREGVYSPHAHRDQLENAGARDPQMTVDVHVRRLEALRRVGVVERLAEGVWSVPQDLVQKAKQVDALKAVGPAIELRSNLPIERQITAMGSTWLDRELVSNGTQTAAGVGFGGQAGEALQRRVDFLQSEGLAHRQGLRVVLARNLLGTLRDKELASAGQALQEQTGKVWRAVAEGQTATGIYRQSVQLVSGRFAMLDDGLGFSLVPWKPVIEPRLGQQLSGVVRGSSVTWNLGRQRGISV